MEESVLAFWPWGHALDAEQVPCYQSLTTLHKFLARRPALASMLRTVWELSKARSSRRHGPIKIIGIVLKRSCWQWPCSEVMITGTGDRLELPTLHVRAFQHEVREALRRMMVPTLPS